MNSPSKSVVPLPFRGFLFRNTEQPLRSGSRGLFATLDSSFFDCSHSFIHSRYRDIELFNQLDTEFDLLLSQKGNTMAGSKIICNCMEVDYLSIRMAMVNHTARTVEEIQQITGAGTGCGGCIPDIEAILASVCGCIGTSLKEVVDAVNAGASTVEAVGEQTKAGTN